MCPAGSNQNSPYEQAKSEADKIGLGEVLSHDSCKPGTPKIRELVAVYST